MPEQILENRASAALQFVQSLTLPEIETLYTAGEPLNLLTSDQASAAVDDQSVVCFTAGLSSQLKSDVLDSTLLAQLAASAKFPRDPNTFEYNVVGWYNCYTDTLQKLGWDIQGLAFSRHQVSGSSFQVNKVVIELLAGLVSSNTGLIVQSALDALNAAKADQSKALSLWKSHTDNDANGTFQIACCSESGGCAAMALSAFYMTSKDKIRQILWCDYSSSDTQLQNANTQVVLNNSVYSHVRSAVAQKLAGRAASFVADLDIDI